MNILRTLSLPLLTLLIVGAHAASAQESIDESRDVAPNERIELDVMRGEVRIRPAQQNVFRVRGTLDEEAEGFSLESSGGSTRFSVDLPRSAGRWGDGRDVESPSDLDIELPAGATLEFHGVSTQVTVTGIAGGSEITSVNGRIEVSDLGERVILSTVNGSIRSNGVSGQLTVSSVNGDIEDSGSRGRVEYSSVNGSIRATSSAQEVTLESVNGDAALQLEGTAQLSLETVNGDFDITLTQSSAPRVQGSSVSGNLRLALDGTPDVRVALETHSGDISNGISADAASGERFGPRKSLHVTFGQGSGLIELRSISGDLGLTRP
jgi:DUF4097 and DUF4098 domain-containing protein YvlB